MGSFCEIRGKLSYQAISNILFHPFFATTTGFSFTLFAAGHAFMSRGAQRKAAIALTVIATAVPLIMFGIPLLMGISQRFMFIVAFYWLFFYYSSEDGTDTSMEKGLSF